MLLKHGLAGLGYKAATGGAITFVSSTARQDLALDASQIETTVAMPGSLLENDLVVAAWVCDNDVTTGATVVTGDLTIKTGQGWTDVAISGESSPGTPGYAIQIKKMGVTPDTTISYFPNNLRPSAVLIQVFRGVDTTTPQDATATGPSTGTTGNPNSPSITTVTANAWVLAVGLIDDSNTALTAPSGYTNLGTAIANTPGANTSSQAAISSKIVASAGAEDPAAYTGDDDEWTAFTLALRPA